MKNREARAILPEADAESEDFRDGVIEGFHNAGEDIRKRHVLNDEDIEHNSSGCKNTDWCKGWAAGYHVRIDRWNHKGSDDGHAGKN